MYCKLAVIVVILTFTHHSVAQTYKAAVYEHTPSIKETAEITILSNINYYRDAMATAKANRVDIIVFPEYGLTGLNASNNPAPYATSIPSRNTGPFRNHILKELSDLAGDNAIYVVVNLLESAKNEANETLYYNTNLVFDRNGNILTRYRKINLYNEDKLTPGNTTVTFLTDFGVTFGIFTCFDIVYYKPSREIFEIAEVTDVIYPAAWFSTLPFYSALSVQHGYSLANGVNLLSANYDSPQDGNGGSGIYFSDGKIGDTFMGLTATSKSVIKDVKIISSREKRDKCFTVTPFSLPGGLSNDPNITSFITRKDFKSSDYSFRDVDLSKDKNSIEVCSGKFCCTFNITVYEPNNNEIYKLVAFDGLTVFDNEKQHVRVCSLLACQNNNHDSCGERINGTTKFRISVEGNLPNDNTTFYQPVTLNYNLRPIEQISYCNQDLENEQAKVQVISRDTLGQVLVFGIYGRSSGIKVSAGFFLIIMFAIIKFLFH